MIRCMLALSVAAIMTFGTYQYRSMYLDERTARIATECLWFGADNSEKYLGLKCP